MTVHGSLTSLPLSDALQWLSQGGKTGALKLVTPEGKSTILFTKGSIVGVELSLPDLLSDLTRQGLADEESIRSVLATMESGSWTQTRILTALGIAESEIDSAMANTSERAIIGLLSSTEGTFIFEPAPGEEAERTERAGRNHTPLAVPRLLLSGAQQVDESRRAQAELAAASPTQPTEPEPIPAPDVTANEPQPSPVSDPTTPDSEIETLETREETLPGTEIFEVEESLPAIAHIDDFRAPISAPSAPLAAPAATGAPLAAAAELAPAFGATAEPETAEVEIPEADLSESASAEPDSLPTPPQLADEISFVDDTLSSSSPPSNPWTSRNGMIAAAVAIAVLVVGILVWQSGFLANEPAEPAFASTVTPADGTLAESTTTINPATTGETDASATTPAPDSAADEAAIAAAQEARTAELALADQQAEAAALDRRVEELVASRTADIESNLRAEYSAEAERIRQEELQAQSELETTPQSPAAERVAEPDQIAAAIPTTQQPQPQASTDPAATQPAAETNPLPVATSAAIPAAEAPTSPAGSSEVGAGSAVAEAAQEVPEQVIVTTPIAVTLPSLISHPPPRYSNQMRQTGHEVTVIVKVVVDATGAVTEAELPNKKQGFGFDSMALWMARNSTWKPGTSAGEATQMRAEMRVVFRP